MKFSELIKFRIQTDQSSLTVIKDISSARRHPHFFNASFTSTKKIQMQHKT